MDVLPLCLDLDGSIPLQKPLAAALAKIVDLRAAEHDMRLWANRTGLAAVRRTIHELRGQYPQPWLTFLGSGDFHHMTLLLLETLPPQTRPVTLVLIDNHPDWFIWPPRYHCGNWVAGALRLPWVDSVVLIGQDSEDLQGHCFWTAPFGALCAGRVQLFPYARSSVRVPLRWPVSVAGASRATRRWYGVDMGFDTIEQRGADQVFEELASRVAGRHVYVSIDKDCLASQWALTDWEQGRLSIEELQRGLQRLRASTQIVGIDICGEAAPHPLRGLLKRLDAGRLIAHPPVSLDGHRVNERTNLALLGACATE